MCNLAEEKYLVALFVRVAKNFSIPQILEGVRTDQVLDAVYTVVGELLEKGLIRVSRDFRITRDNSIARVYEVVQERRDELEQYVEELDKQKTQPDSQGKPRGLNYQIAEGLIQEVIAHPESLESEEKESLLASIYYYLALAQEEEMTEQSEKVSPSQTAIAEAHLRMLYAEYLWFRKEWTKAIDQLLEAHRLFNENGLVEKRRNAELRACEVLNDEYREIKQGRELEQGIDELINKHAKGETSVLFTLAQQILRELKETDWDSQSDILSSLLSYKDRYPHSRIRYLSSTPETKSIKSERISTAVLSVVVGMPAMEAQGIKEVRSLGGQSHLNSGTEARSPVRTEQLTTV